MPFITDEGLRLPPRHSCVHFHVQITTVLAPRHSYYCTCTIQRQYCCNQFGQPAHHHGPLQPEAMDIQLTFQVRPNSQIFGSQKVQNVLCMRSSSDYSVACNESAHKQADQYQLVRRSPPHIWSPVDIAAAGSPIVFDSESTCICLGWVGGWGGGEGESLSIHTLGVPSRVP